MTEEMEQCENCLKMFPESKIATHFGYCRRNIKKCVKCGEFYDINFEEEHQEQFHKTVNCQYCNKDFGQSDYEVHLKNCDKKPKFCQYCELKVPTSGFDIHLKQCESRTKKCDQCNKPIMNKDFLIHISTCKGIIEEEKKEVIPNYAQRVQCHKSKYQPQIKKQNYRKYEYISSQKQQDPYALRQKKQVKVDHEIKKWEKKETKPNYAGYKPMISQPKEQIRSSKDIIDKKYTSKAQPIQKSYGSREHIKYPQQPVRNSSKNRPLREDPPKMNSRQSKIVNYKKNDVKIPSSKNIPIATNIVIKNNPSSEYSYKYSRQIKGNQNKPISHNISNNHRKLEVPTKDNKQQKRTPIFKPEDYGGYQSYQMSNGHDSHPHSVHTNEYIQNQDAELQRAIMMSMAEKKNIPKNIPSQLIAGDMMNQSFMMDFDIQKQKAIYQAAQRQAKCNRY